MKAETDLHFIAKTAEQKQDENESFAAYLRQQDSGQVDGLVQLLNKQAEAVIDCTQCGNCCRSLMINVEEKEAAELAEHLQLSREAFEEKYVEKGSGGMMVVNAIPCHFLSGNTCSIYAYRFADCRRFPNLHLPGFTRRLFATFMHYGRCPIVFSVMEALKENMNWQYPEK